MSLAYLSAGREFLYWLRLQTDRPRLCTYVRCTGILIVNAARQTVCTYVHVIHGDLHLDDLTDLTPVDRSLVSHETSTS